MRRLMPHFDGFFAHSGYYRDFMSGYLEILPERFDLLPLGIELEGHDGEPHDSPDGQFTIGYFADLPREGAAPPARRVPDPAPEASPRRDAGGRLPGASRTATIFAN